MGHVYSSFEQRNLENSTSNIAVAVSHEEDRNSCPRYPCSLRDSLEEFDGLNIEHCHQRRVCLYVLVVEIVLKESHGNN